MDLSDLEYYDESKQYKKIILVFNDLKNTFLTNINLGNYDSFSLNNNDILILNYNHNLTRNNVFLFQKDVKIYLYLHNYKVINDLYTFINFLTVVMDNYNIKILFKKETSVYYGFNINDIVDNII